MFRLLHQEKKYLNLLKEQPPKVKIPIKHPGVLEVPEGKDVENLPLDHFKDLVKKKGLSTISKALTNLIVWNREKNPTLSSKIDAIQNKVTSWVEKERESRGNENLYGK
jgi:hypothetical protein